MADDDRLDPYVVLGVSRDCSQQELKQRYQHLVRQFHPDKNMDAGEQERKEKMRAFQHVEKAYGLLKNEKDREIVNAKLTGKDLKQEWPVSDSMQLSDMEYSPAAGSFSYPCRCGGVFELEEDEVPPAEENNTLLVCCSFCTLCIELLPDLQPS